MSLASTHSLLAEKSEAPITIEAFWEDDSVAHPA
jgi:hypothetical protein